MIENAYRDPEYHNEFFTRMGMGKDSVMIIHVRFSLSRVLLSFRSGLKAVILPFPFRAEACTVTRKLRCSDSANTTKSCRTASRRGQSRFYSFSGVSARAKAAILRLVLENDEFSYSVDDLLPVCEDLNIPLVFGASF